MNLKQFFAKLPKDGWYLDKDGLISRELPNGLRACPISSLGNPPRSCGQFLTAAAEIGLSRHLAVSIACAADGNRRRNPNIAELRQRLLTHCGLEAQDSC